MKTVLITGANRGIALALTQQFMARGDRVIAACRHASEALSATKAQVETGVDVSDDQTVAAPAKRLGETRIDVLVLNAGIMTCPGR